MRQVKGHLATTQQQFAERLPHRAPETRETRYLQSEVRPPERADPALRSEADGQRKRRARVAVAQRDGQLRHCHRETQLLPAALLQQHPEWSKHKKTSQTRFHAKVASFNVA